VGKIAEKVVCECIFDNMALYFESQINITALLQTVFLAIFPTGVRFKVTKFNVKRRVDFTISLSDTC